MASPVTVAIALTAADPDGIAKLQTLAAAGSLTLDGDLVQGGVARLTSPGMGRQVIITSTGNDTGVVFIITGTNATGNGQAETLAGATGGAATSQLFYSTVTDITASAATDGDVSAGTNAVGATRVVNIDTALNPVNTSITAAVAGSVTYTLQWTNGDIQGLPTWVDDANMASKSGAFATSNAFPVSGYRIRVTTGDGTVVATVLQSGLGS